MIKIRIFKQASVGLSFSRVEQSKHYKLNSDQSSANQLARKSPQLLENALERIGLSNFCDRFGRMELA